MMNKWTTILPLLPASPGVIIETGKGTGTGKARGKETIEAPIPNIGATNTVVRIVQFLVRYCLTDKLIRILLV